MLIESHRQGQHRSRFKPVFTSAVNRTKPAEVAFQVRRGDTLESSEPGFEPAVIRVGVLNMPGVAHALTGAQVHSLMLYAQILWSPQPWPPSRPCTAAVSLWMRDSSAWLRQALDTVSNRKSAVASDRSRATRTGIKSMPRSWRDAHPPRLRDLRPVRWPLLKRKKKVSSASTTPVSCDALTGCANSKKQ